MGTNFYWKRELECLEELGDSDDPKVHIGKRSAAGWYCWDCNLSLVDSQRYTTTCRKCGQSGQDIDLFREGAAAVELGLAEPNMNEPAGVYPASSFTWAQAPESVFERCEFNSQDKIICDEYGREFSGEQFMTMLRCNCPLFNLDMIGRMFC